MSVKKCVRVVLIPKRPDSIKKSAVDAAFEKVRSIKTARHKKAAGKPIYLRGMN